VATDNPHRYANNHKNKSSIKAFEKRIFRFSFSNRRISMLDMGSNRILLRSWDKISRSGCEKSCALKYQQITVNGGNSNLTCGSGQQAYVPDCNLQQVFSSGQVCCEPGQSTSRADGFLLLTVIAFQDMEC